MELTCSFHVCYYGYGDDTQYTCFVKSGSITESNTTIKSIQGTHLEGKSISDVTSIYFGEGNYVKYFPRGLHKIFPSLKCLSIEYCSLKEISREDFIGLENLEAVVLDGNALTSLPNDLLQGMHKLKTISFNQNKLKYLSSKLLKSLPENNWRYIGFQNNTRINLSFSDCNPFSQLFDLFCSIDENCGSVTWTRNAKIANKEMWMSRRLSDFTINVGEKSFNVHKYTLATHSSVFMTMLENDNKETQEGKMIIKDFSSEVVEEFLHYIYTGEIPDATNAMDLFAMAAKYDVPGLKEDCDEILLENLNASNALAILHLGNLYGSENMKKLAFIELKKMFPDHNIPNEMMNQPELFEGLV